MIEAKPLPGANFATTTARDRPLVRSLSLGQLQEAEAKRDADGEMTNQLNAGEPYFTQESALAGHIRFAWQRNKIFKNKTALRMLRCLRARRGVFSQMELSTLQQMGVVNMIWHDITETKCRAGAAWIREVLMPPNDWPFSLEAGSVPDIPPATRKAIMDSAIAKTKRLLQMQFQQTGEAMTREEFGESLREMNEKMIDRAQAIIKKTAQGAAGRMEERIRSNMEQGGFRRALDDFIEDFVTFPAAVIKGPYLGRGQSRLTWSAGWLPTIDSSPRQQWRRVDPFDVYPAPWASDCQTGEFIERVRFMRSALYDCIGLPGFKEAELRAALRDYTNGHLEGWLWTEAERQRLQQDTMYTWLSPAGVIDGLQFWGGVPGWMLMSWGIQNFEELDPVKDYEVAALIIGPYVVQCQLNPDPLNKRPYRKACYDEVPGAFWGRSVPDLNETPQKMCNACAMASADNMGWASGFQTWIHVDRLADGESSLDVSPGRLWQLRSDPTQGVNPGIGFFQPSSNVEQLSAMLDKWELKADDATGIPRYVYGNEAIGGAADTYAGLSMLMNNAAKGLRRAISNIDIGILEPTVMDSFVLEMLDPNCPVDAKCDAKVVPSGATSILIKEARNQARLNALTIVGQNPWLQQIVGLKGGARLLDQALSSMEIDTLDIIPEDSDLEQMQASQAQQSSQMQQMEMAQQQQELANKTAETQSKVQTNAGKLQLEDKAIDSRERIAGAQIAASHASKTMAIGAGLQKDANQQAQQPNPNAQGAVSQNAGSTPAAQGAMPQQA